jgi:purine-binding chemotaxis protein CheW
MKEAKMEQTEDGKNSEKRILMYGTFLQGQTEFGIEVARILEVVNLPTRLTAVPLAPNFVSGVFSLRGMIIPVLDIGILLSIPPEQEGLRKVVIVEHEGLKIGLAFDSTKEIVRVSPDLKLDIDYSEGSGPQVVGALLKLDDGKRIIQLIQPEKVVRVENLPHVMEALKATAIRSQARRSSDAKRKQCISFRIGQNLLALEIEAVSEIITMPEVIDSALKSEHCVGMSTLRNVVLPLIRFDHLLGVRDADSSEVLDGKKVIVMKLGKDLFGIIIDSVENITTYFSDEVVPVPVFSRDRREFLVGCLSFPDHPDILILNHEKIFTDDEITSITHGHSILFRPEDVTEASKTKTGTSKKSNYILFQMGYKAAIDMSEIQEIIPYPTDLIQSPGSASFISGLLNWRGELVSVISLRNLYELEALATEDTPKVLIIRRHDSIYGLTVDSIDGTMTVDESKKLPIPSLLAPEMAEPMKSDLKEIIEPPGDTSSNKSVMIFDLDAVVARIGQA